MKSDETGRCVSCKFARWQMTARNPPRINARCCGTCSWPMPERLPVAICMRMSVDRAVIWAGDTVICPVWEGKGEESSQGKLPKPPQPKEAGR